MTRLIKMLQLIIFMSLLTGCVYTIQNQEIIEKDKFVSIKELQDIDVDGDGMKDEVCLYLNNNLEVILKVREVIVPILTVENKDQILENIPSDHYICELFCEGNKMFVGVTYCGTNKYGSTSFIECYEYKLGNINKIWSSSNIRDKKIGVHSFNQNSHTLNIAVDKDVKKIVLDDEEEISYLEYIEKLKKKGKRIELELGPMPEYEFNNYSNKFVTRNIVWITSCYIEEVYFSIENFYTEYKFSHEGISKVDSWFGSTRS